MALIFSGVLSVARRLPAQTQNVPLNKLLQQRKTQVLKLSLPQHETNFSRHFIAASPRKIACAHKAAFNKCLVVIIPTEILG